jgi:hypothetical protein
MRFCRFVLFAILLTANSHAQQLPAAQKQIADAARARYYSLTNEGFQSLTCSVEFDWTTVPLVSPTDADSTLAVLKSARFILTIDDKGRPKLDHAYPKALIPKDEQVISQQTNLLNSLVLGLFQTWPTKGLAGPIPAFDNSIEGVKPVDDGFVFNLRVPGGPVEIFTDRNYLVTKITSIGGKVEEYPVYSVSSKGLIFAGNRALDTGQSPPVEVSYVLDTAEVDGFTVPSSVRLKVNSNIDVQYKLTSCKATRSQVVHVGAGVK